jgi:hypothetical protein
MAKKDTLFMGYVSFQIPILTSSAKKAREIIKRGVVNTQEAVNPKSFCIETWEVESYDDIPKCLLKDHPLTYGNLLEGTVQEIVKAQGLTKHKSYQDDDYVPNFIDSPFDLEDNDFTEVSKPKKKCPVKKVKSSPKKKTTKSSPKRVKRIKKATWR